MAVRASTKYVCTVCPALLHKRPGQPLIPGANAPGLCCLLIAEVSRDYIERRNALAGSLLARVADQSALAVLTGGSLQLNLLSGVPNALLFDHRIHLLVHELLQEPVSTQLIAIGGTDQVEEMSRKLQDVERDVRPVLESMIASEIKAVVFKGADLRHNIYPSPLCRPAADVDILVPEQSLDRAIECLLDNGFSKYLGLGGHRIRRSFDYELGFTTTASYVDLHWDLTPRLGVPTFDLEKLFEESTEVESSLGKYWRMHYSHAWVHVAWHMYDSSDLGSIWPLQANDVLKIAEGDTAKLQNFQFIQLIDLMLLSAQHNENDSHTEIARLSNESNTSHVISAILHLTRQLMPETFEYLNLAALSDQLNVDEHRRHSIVGMLPLAATRIPLINVRIVRVAEIIDFLVPASLVLEARYGSSSLRWRFVHFIRASLSVGRQLISTGQAVVIVIGLSLPVLRRANRPSRD